MEMEREMEKQTKAQETIPEKEPVKIKICGLTCLRDVESVNEAKPDFCGFVINVPGRRRSISVEQLRTLVRELSPEIVPVGVFLDAPVALVKEVLAEGLVQTAQLHGREDEAYIRELKAQGDYTIIKAFREDTLQNAQGSGADYVLLDHAGGGTGETFDWALAKQVKRPFFLAGGIGPDNLAGALAVVRPWAVDMSTKVETDGHKDREKILAAVRAVRAYGCAAP